LPHLFVTEKISRVFNMPLFLFFYSLVLVKKSNFSMHFYVSAGLEGFDFAKTRPTANPAIAAIAMANNP